MTPRATLVEQPEPVEPTPAQPVPSAWTNEQLIGVYRLGYGPGIIGKAMFDAAQAYGKSSAGGVLGPATRGD